MKLKKAHVVIQTAFLGDLILSIPLFKRIKKVWPNHELIVICKKGLGDFLIKEEIVDRCIEVAKSDRASYQEAVTLLSPTCIENVYCVHESIRSLLFAAQLKAEKKIGYASFFGFWVFDDLIDHVSEWPEVMRLFKILETTDQVIQKAINQDDWEKLNAFTDEGRLETIPAEFAFEKRHYKIVANAKNKIALFPGSVWATKRWTPDGYMAVAKYFLKSGYEVDLLGGPDEKKLCEMIAAEAKGSQVLAGQLSISESLNAVANYNLVICNDSASTHMAAYQGVPVISIFGPTTLDLGFRPWSAKSRVIQNNKLNCRPCGKHGHVKCPLGHHHCMNQLSAEAVIDAAQDFLKIIDQ